MDKTQLLETVGLNISGQQTKSLAILNTIYNKNIDDVIQQLRGGDTSLILLFGDYTLFEKLIVWRKTYKPNNITQSKLYLAAQSSSYNDIKKYLQLAWVEGIYEKIEFFHKFWKNVLCKYIDETREIFKKNLIQNKYFDISHTPSQNEINVAKILQNLSESDNKGSSDSTYNSHEFSKSCRKRRRRNSFHELCEEHLIGDPDYPLTYTQLNSINYLFKYDQDSISRIKWNFLSRNYRSYRNYREAITSYLKRTQVANKIYFGNIDPVE
jgi:hypothetical protein